MDAFFQTYPTSDLIVIFLSISFAALAKGVTGIGFSTVAVTLLAATIGLKDGMPIVIIPSLVSNFLVMRTAGQFQEAIVRFRWLYLAAPVGIFLGVSILVSVPEAIAEAVLGGTLISYCVFALLNPNFKFSDKVENRLKAPVGLATGFLNGITGAQIVPLGPFVLSLRLSPNLTVQALNCSFTISSFALLLSLGVAGIFTVWGLLLALPCVLVTIIGVKAGERIRANFAPETFRLAIIILMLILGIIFVLRILL